MEQDSEKYSRAVYPHLHKGVNLLANLQFRVFVSPFYQMARGVRCGDREALVEKITVVGRKLLIVSLLDGTEVECDATSF